MTGEHVEVRVTGRQEAVDAVLRLLRAAGPGSGITGGGARGPYDRGGRVAFYAHLQVEVAPPATRRECRGVTPPGQPQRKGPTR